MISYPSDSKPRLELNHIDGPLLICRDGTPHWLSFAEVLSLKMGFTNVNQLDEKYNHEPRRG